MYNMTTARPDSPRRLFAITVAGSFDCQYAHLTRGDAKGMLNVLPRTLDAAVVEIAPAEPKDKPSCFVVLVEGQDAYWTFAKGTDARREAAGRHVSLDGRVQKASVLPCTARASVKASGHRLAAKQEA
jgi:hypothetical protein